MTGKNIKHAREEKGFTQEELAARLNVTRQAVSSWETGKTGPDVETLGKIALELDVPVEQLIYGGPRKKAEISLSAAKGGVTFGTVLAIVISYAKWQSIGWAIFHGLLNWVYVIYYVLTY